MPLTCTALEFFCGKIFSYGEVPGSVLHRPKGCPNGVWALMKQCWADSTLNRPTPKQAASQLCST